MNPLLAKLNPYPFERLRNMMQDVKANPQLSEINLTIGEPLHELPPFVKEVMNQYYLKLAKYPTTTGTAEFREACAKWLQSRYQVNLDATKEILPVNGTREALFSFVQATLNSQCESKAIVVVPNPFYQIYEGATLLAGGELVYANTVAPRFLPDWSQVTDENWQRTQIVFVCTPDNPTGSIMDYQDWQQLFELQAKYNFVIASDECYSEIYFKQQPIGILQAAQHFGLDYSNKVMFTSLSKRSNLPGLRSGFVAGDGKLLADFLQYRTYHGSAMSELVQHISIAAWGDERHVAANRQLYQQKFEQVIAILRTKYQVYTPDASFYLWLPLPNGDDIEFSKRLYAEQSIKVLPGSLLAKDTPYGNPGKAYVRIALVAPLAQCVTAAHRMVQL